MSKDRRRRGLSDRAAEEMAEKTPLEAVRDDMGEIKDELKGIVTNNDDDGTDATPPEETTVDEVDKPRRLPGDQPSDK